MLRLRIVVAIAVLLGLSAGTTTAQTLYGMGSEFISINPGTAAGTLIKKMPGAVNIPGISFRGSNLYGWDSGSSRILQIDPLTGNILTKIDIGKIGGTVGDVAFRSDGIGFLGMSGTLHQFDITVPNSKVITKSLKPTMTALAFNSADMLFGVGWQWDTLYTIDQVTGATTVVGPTGINGKGGSGMTFSSTGTLYFAGGGKLHTINPATGAATMIGVIGYSPPGLASPLTAVVSAGVTIVESGGSTDVTEGGATDTYTVVLNTVPAANVTITLTPDAFVTVAPAVLTFTPANWSVPQTVTVTAVDDAIPQGPHTGTIKHSAASADPVYKGISVSDVVANVTDNDSVAGVTITQPSGSTNVTEGADTDIYFVVLNAAPIANVTITVNPGAWETVAPNTLTFTPANWNVPQFVTVTAFDDNIYQGLHFGSISHTAASADPAYNGIPIASVAVNITDNDLPPQSGIDEGTYAGSSGPTGFGHEGGFGFGSGRMKATKSPRPVRAPILSDPVAAGTRGSPNFLVLNVSHKQTADSNSPSSGMGLLAWTLLASVFLGSICILAVKARPAITKGMP